MIGCILAIIICAVGFTKGIIEKRTVISTLWAISLTIWIINLINVVRH